MIEGGGDEHGVGRADFFVKRDGEPFFPSAPRVREKLRAGVTEPRQIIILRRHALCAEIAADTAIAQPSYRGCLIQVVSEQQVKGLPIRGFVRRPEGQGQTGMLDLVEVDFREVGAVAE